MEDAAGSDFARVKSLWQTRVASRETATAPPTASSAADSERTATLSPTAAATGTAPRKASFLHAREPPQQQVVAADSPHTPAPDEYFYAGDKDESAPASPEASPMSSASTMSVSPSRSVTTAPVSVVNSVLRTLSDATLLRGRSTSGANATNPHNNNSAIANGSDGAASTESSPKDAMSHLSLSSLPVPNMPDMSGWKEKMKSYSSKSGKSSPPAAPSSAAAAASTPAAATTSKLKTLASISSISTTWKSMSAHSMKAALNEMNNGPELAKNNVHHMCAKAKPGVSNSALTSGSPYGELIVVEVLSARDLALESSRDNNTEACDVRPFAVVQFDSVLRKSLAPRYATTATGAQLVHSFNERFVFWVPSSPSIDQQTVSITFRRMSASSGVPRPQPSANTDSIDDHVGEVHLSLAMPVNEVFDDWFPLVRACDGAKKGTAHIGLRRLVLTSPTLLEAAKTLASRNRSLNKADRNAFGSTLPELWNGFTDVATDATSASESATTGAASTATVTRLGKPKDVLASKLTGLSRRFMGVGLSSSSSDVRRDVF